MDKKKVVISIIASIISVVLFVWMLWLIVWFDLEKPGYPEITYGEFSICLEYKIGDKHIKIEDELVCEFDGFGFNEGNGLFRKWKASLKSGNTRITIFKDSDIEIYFFPIKNDSRLPGVFMGDTEFYSGGTGDSFPDAWYTMDYESRVVNDYIISADEMKNKYNIQLISWECASPIENNFE